MSHLPKRKPNRLKGYDYSQNGAYFITICSKDKRCLFGNVVVGDAAHGVPLSGPHGVPLSGPLGVPPDAAAHSIPLMSGELSVTDVGGTPKAASPTATCVSSGRLSTCATPVGDAALGVPPAAAHSVPLMSGELSVADVDGTPKAASPTATCLSPERLSTCATPVGDAALGVPPSGPLGVPHIELSEIGKIVEHFIVGIGDMLDAYVIMPNHVHMILIVDSGIGTLPVAVGGTSPAAVGGTSPTAVGGTSPTAVGGTPRAASPTKAVIPKIVNSFKGLASKKAGFALWQRSYYDHIIRSETDYARILEYIENNPLKWKLDSLYMEE